MTGRSPTKATGLFLTIMLLPFVATAQRAGEAFEDLSRSGTLHDGDAIRITFAYRHADDEVEIEGDLVDLTNTTITVRVDSLPMGTTDLGLAHDRQGTQVEIPADRVRRIELARRGGSLWNGFLIGGAVGAGTMGAMFYGLTGFDEELAQTAAIGFGIGAVIGLAADAASRGDRRVVYVAPGAASARSLVFHAAPLVSEKRKGLLFTLRW